MTAVIHTALQVAWNRLESEDPPEAGGLRTALLDIDLGLGVLRLGQDALRHLLVPISANTRIREERATTGVRLVRRTLESDEGLKTFIDLSCLKPHLHAEFDQVIAEVIERLRAGGDPSAICQAVLGRFRELLERQPPGLLGDEFVLGLLGELSYLAELAERNPGVLRFWAGPEGARHDFQPPRSAIEVKATRTSRGRFFKVSSHDQLALPADGDLYFAGLVFEQTPGGDLSLPALIGRVRSAGVDGVELDQKLRRVGYDESRTDEYAAIRFKLREDDLYRVVGDFPRLTVEQLKGGALPSGVLDITYSIDLTGDQVRPLMDDERSRVLDEVAGQAH